MKKHFSLHGLYKKYFSALTREVACSASDRQGSNFESCVWRTESSQSSHHPQEVLLAQFSLYVHKGGLKPDSFHFNPFKPEFTIVIFIHNKPRIAVAILGLLWMKMIWCGWKSKENCHVLVNQFHFHSKTLGCRKIKSVFRDLKWCFNASWGLKGLRVLTMFVSLSLPGTDITVVHVAGDHKTQAPPTRLTVNYHHIPGVRVQTRVDGFTDAAESLQRGSQMVRPAEVQHLREKQKVQIYPYTAEVLVSIFIHLKLH